MLRSDTKRNPNVLPSLDKEGLAAASGCRRGGSSSWGYLPTAWPSWQPPPPACSTPTSPPQLGRAVSSRCQALFGLLLATLCFVCPSPGIAATDLERYSGVMTLPIDLFTQEGTKIEKRKYEIEVKSDLRHWTLSFVSEGKNSVIVKGTIAAGDPFTLPARIPLVGTHHMRSSSEPLKTAQERQFSKTGLPQYAEQERDWKATVRVYKSSSEPGEVFFVFQVRDASGKVTRADFNLHSEALQEKR